MKYERFSERGWRLLECLVIEEEKKSIAKKQGITVNNIPQEGLEPRCKLFHGLDLCKCAIDVLHLSQT